MKAKDLKDVPKGTVIEIPWDLYSRMNCELEGVYHYDNEEIEVYVNIAGLGSRTAYLDPEQEVTVLGVEPILKSIDAEAIQFRDDPDTIRDIVEFVDGIEHEVETDQSIIFGETKVLSIYGTLFSDSIREGEWLIKRNGQIVKLNDKNFNILFR